MNRFLIWLVAGLLAGCVGGTRNLSPAEVYDFGAPVEPLAEEGRWSSVLLDIRAPHWFDARDIDYRLLYENPLKLRNYARSHWVAAPALLLSQRLRQQLGLPGVGGQIVAGCVLRFELQEFSQVFDTPRRSRGILQGQAGLLDTRRQLVAERRLAIEQPAPTADAHGGVIALVAVSEELGREFAAWLNDLEKRGRLKGCRSTAGESPSH